MLDQFIPGVFQVALDADAIPGYSQAMTSKVSTPTDISIKFGAGFYAKGEDHAAGN